MNMARAVQPRQGQTLPFRLFRGLQDSACPCLPHEDDSSISFVGGSFGSTHWHVVSLGLLKLAFGSLKGIGQASSRTHESLPQGPVYQRGDDSLGVEFKLVGGLGFQFLANVKKFRKTLLMILAVVRQTSHAPCLAVLGFKTNCGATSVVHAKRAQRFNQAFLYCTSVIFL